MSLGDILIKSLVTSTDLDHWDSGLQLTVLSVWTNQVKLIPDVNDRDRDMKLVNDCCNSLLESVALSLPEWNWGFSEENVSLVLNDLFGDLVLSKLITVVLIGLLLDSNRLSLSSLLFVQFHQEKSLSLSFLPCESLSVKSLLFISSFLVCTFHGSSLLESIDLILQLHQSVLFDVNLVLQTGFHSVDKFLVFFLDLIMLSKLDVNLLLDLLGNLGVIYLSLVEALLFDLKSLLDIVSLDLFRIFLLSQVLNLLEFSLSLIFYFSFIMLSNLIHLRLENFQSFSLSLDVLRLLSKVIFLRFLVHVNLFLRVILHLLERRLKLSHLISFLSLSKTLKISQLSLDFIGHSLVLDHGFGIQVLLLTLEIFVIIDDFVNCSNVRQEVLVAILDSLANLWDEWPAVHLLEHAAVA